MFFEFVKNFAILFSFTILIFWPFIHYSKKHFIMKYKSIITGLTFGAVAIVLTWLTFPFANGTFINSRSTLLLFSGLLGGPISVLITGILIVASRYMLLFTSMLSFVMMINMFCVTLITSYVAYKKPITYHNISKYFLFITLEQSIVLLIYYQFSFQSMRYVSTYVIFTTFTFFATYVILNKLQSTKEQVEQIYTLSEINFLTQLPNSLAFEKKMQLHMQAKIPFELLHMNLKNLQHINTTMSYTMGDQVLKQIGPVLKQLLPNEEALIGHTAGNDFFILLPHYAPANAIAFADEVKRAVESIVFYDVKQQPFSVACAIGISSYPKAKTMHTLYTESNQALKHAKHTTEIAITHYNELHAHPTN